MKTIPSLFVRIDDRLIHGQVIMGWVPFLRPRRIVVVSAEAAADDSAAQVMAMGVPEEIEFLVLSPEAAPARLAALAPAPTFVVAAGPVDLLPYARSGAAPKTINLGGMRYAAGREVAPDLILRDEDIDAFRQLFALGLVVERRLIPSAPAVPLQVLLAAVGITE